jgi:hypothetical protein
VCSPELSGKRAVRTGLQPAFFHVGTGQRGKRIGGLHQRVLGHLAHAGLDLHHEDAQHEKGGQAVDQEEGKEEAQAQTHTGYPGWFRL